VPHRNQGDRPEGGDPGVAEFGAAVLQRHRLRNEPFDGMVGGNERLVRRGDVRWKTGRHGQRHLTQLVGGA
jgi:hypothetical protein